MGGQGKLSFDEVRFKLRVFSLRRGILPREALDPFSASAAKPEKKFRVDFDFSDPRGFIEILKLPRLFSLSSHVLIFFKNLTDVLAVSLLQIVNSRLHHS